MYAYREQTQIRPLHAVPQRKRTAPPRVVQKKKKIKKQNPLVYLFRLTFLFSFFSLYAIFVHPTVYNCLIKQVFFPEKIPTVTGFINTMNTQNPCYRTDVDLYRIANPVTNYIHNDMFNNELLLTPTIQKAHSEVTTMYHTTEIAPLKQQLTGLMAQYPSIKPSIYVWEYEQGQYIDIKSNELYPAASIIKLPVLVRMFKSIESGQFKLNDEMKMLEQYRSSGSGNMQYGAAGRSFTMDYLAKVMIEDSDNTSTNMIMAKMGGMDDVNIGLRDWGISKTYIRTWLPDLNGTNKTTAYDIAKILYNLDNPGFLNINSRESIIDYMSHVKNDRLIQAGLGEGALFIHKTGDIGTMLGDAGIVYAPNGKKYIIVILAMRPHNSYQGKEFIVKASEMIYKAIAN